MRPPWLEQSVTHDTHPVDVGARIDVRIGGDLVG